MLNFLIIFVIAEIVVFATETKSQESKEHSSREELRYWSTAQHLKWESRI